MSYKIFIFITCFLFLISPGICLERADPDQLRPNKTNSLQTPGPRRLISMDFQDAQLKDVLKVFSQQAGLNFIASENVKERKVTLYMDKVSVADALNTLLEASHLTYEQKKDSQIFVVKEWGRPQVETVTKIYPLQYAKVKGYELTAAGQKEVIKKELGIKEVLERLLSAHGSITEDPRTNSVVITDVPSQFTGIEKAIRELDIKLAQVMIEVEVLETTVEAIDKLGIEWGSSSAGNLVTAAGAERSVTYPFTKPQEMSKVGPAGDTDDLHLGYISATNLGGTLAMLDKDSDTRLLARPKILTLNNKEAEIKIITQTAVASIDKITGGAEGIGTQTVEAERIETGVTLKVTPQINKAGDITMLIEPAVTNTKWSSFFSGTYVDPQTRSVKTTVSVQDGQTVIIGGLINIEDAKTLRKVPYFAEIPFLGNLFRKQDDSVEERELIIFITPHLVGEQQQDLAGLFPGSTRAFWEGERLSWESDSFGVKEKTVQEALDRFED
ncbi:secretin N-terminal domain-containing protein [Candidatus Omnitrophota bacterium]